MRFVKNALEPQRVAFAVPKHLFDRGIGNGMYHATTLPRCLAWVAHRWNAVMVYLGLTHPGHGPKCGCRECHHKLWDFTLGGKQ